MDNTAGGLSMPRVSRATAFRKNLRAYMLFFVKILSCFRILGRAPRLISSFFWVRKLCVVLKANLLSILW